MSVSVLARLQLAREADDAWKALQADDSWKALIAARATADPSSNAGGAHRKEFAHPLDAPRPHPIGAPRPCDAGVIPQTSGYIGAIGSLARARAVGKTAAGAVGKTAAGAAGKTAARAVRASPIGCARKIARGRARKITRRAFGKTAARAVASSAPGAAGKTAALALADDSSASGSVALTSSGAVGMTAEGAVALIAAEVLPEAWQKALARPMTLTGMDLVDARCEAEMRRESLVLERQGSWPSARLAALPSMGSSNHNYNTLCAKAVIIA